MFSHTTPCGGYNTSRSFRPVLCLYVLLGGVLSLGLFSPSLPDSFPLHTLIHRIVPAIADHHMLPDLWAEPGPFPVRVLSA